MLAPPSTTSTRPSPGSSSAARTSGLAWHEEKESRRVLWHARVVIAWCMCCHSRSVQRGVAGAGQPFAHACHRAGMRKFKRHLVSSLQACHVQ